MSSFFKGPVVYYSDCVNYQVSSSHVKHTWGISEICILPRSSLETVVQDAYRRALALCHLSKAVLMVVTETWETLSQNAQLCCGAGGTLVLPEPTTTHEAGTH